MSDMTEYTHRFLARIVMEAETPLSVGSGNGDMSTDALVAKDVNGLPYIPGTSLAGIIRHAINDENEAKQFFGFQVPDKPKEGKGSDIIFTEARIVGSNGKVIDGMASIPWNDEFYSHFIDLPIRQHARINEKGTAADMGKFDEQVVFKGTRFCFELEMVSNGENWNCFDKVLHLLCADSFRVGSGTRNGFGKMKIVSCKTKCLDLKGNHEDLKFYINKSSDLSEDWEGEKYGKTVNIGDWVKYHLTLNPEDFFLFGSGFGDEDADMTPVKESYIQWDENNGRGKFINDALLIPATSLKGALAHRVAYHYNKYECVFADEIDKEDFEKHTGKNNTAVKALFGSEGEKEDGKMKNQMRGNVIFSDIIGLVNTSSKIMNHVAIDRFTGGAMDSALFTETTIYAKGLKFETDILVDKKAFTEENVKRAFEDAIDDICKGLLPLGGGVNRGNGAFTGSLK